MPAQQNNMMLIHTPEDAKAFVTAYNTAISSYKTQFRYKERDIIVSYARYTIEYMKVAKYIDGDFDKDKKFILK